MSRELVIPFTLPQQFPYPVNKVVYCGEVLLDLSEDDVTADKVLKGVVFHNNKGEKLVGTYVPPTN